MEFWKKRTKVTEILNLFHESYRENERLGIHFKALTISEGELKNHLKSTPLFVLRDNEKLISTVAVRLPWSLNPAPFSLPHIGWLATAVEEQNKGYSKQLLSELEELIFKTYGVPAYTLGTALEHPWLVETYKKLGFEVLTEVQLFSDHKTVYMIKILDKQSLQSVSDSRLQAYLEERRLYEF